MKKILIIVLVLALPGGIAFWFLYRWYRTGFVSGWWKMSTADQNRYLAALDRAQGTNGSKYE